MRLENKTAMVTGAASGIGKQIALVFAREGAKVAIADLDQRTADAAAAEIDASGKRASVLPWTSPTSSRWTQAPPR